MSAPVIHPAQRNLVDIAFRCAGLEWNKYVKLDPALIRPAEVEHLIGDSSKARQILGWQPRISFPQLVRMMVDHDCARAHLEAQMTAPSSEFAAQAPATIASVVS